MPQLAFSIVALVGALMVAGVRANAGPALPGAAVTALSGQAVAGPSSGVMLVQFDESGKAVISQNGGSASPLTGSLLPDPSCIGAGCSAFVLTYLLPNPVVTGDVEISEPDGGLSDVLRFTDASGTLSGADAGLGARMIYYSDFELGELNPDLADVSFPANLCGTGVNCTIGPTEVGPEGSNSFDYQPGGVPYPGNNEYRGISDGVLTIVPEPESLALLAGSITVMGLILCWRRQSSGQCFAKSRVYLHSLWYRSLANIGKGIQGSDFWRWGEGSLPHLRMQAEPPLTIPWRLSARSQEIMRFCLPLLLASVLGGLSDPAKAANVILTVGPTGQYDTISAAVAAADADTDLNNHYDIRVAPGIYTNDFPEVTRPMTIESAVIPSQTSLIRPVVLNATIPLPNEKGIILTTSSLTVVGLSFQGAMIDDSLGGNGAGIRDQNTGPGARLTVLSSTFIANQEGILTGDDADETVTIQNSYFINNGNPNPAVFQHAVYVNGGALTVTNSLFCGQLIGHDIKSRASVTTISAVTTYEGQALPNICRAGTASLSVDVPNGGVFAMTGSQLFQGAASENSKMVDYGEEGIAYTTNSIFLQGNFFSSVGLSNSIGIYDPACIPVTLAGNTNIFKGVAIPVSPPECADFVSAGPNAGGAL